MVPIDLTFLPRRNQRVERWQNGGGATRTVAVDPPNAQLASGFRWRVSIASVAVDGPFSRLPGIDRSLWLLRGNGMRLVFGERALVVVAQTYQRLDFPGEVPVVAKLLDGPSEDLNVMTRRGVVAAVSSIERLPGGRPGSCPLDLAPQRLLLALSGQVVVSPPSVGSQPSQSVQLAAGDALRLDGSGAIALAADGRGASVLCVGFYPCGNDTK